MILEYIQDRLSQICSGQIFSRILIWLIKMNLISYNYAYTAVNEVPSLCGSGKLGILH
jgi:hypothetical protein